MRFLEIDKAALISKLDELGAEDRGEDFFEEIIFYDKDLRWQRENKRIVRLRKTKGGVLLAYKHKEDESFMVAKEIEFFVGDLFKCAAFLEEIGLVAYRRQQKRRRSFFMNGVIVDIDEWPRIPVYMELEGDSEEDLKSAAAKLGFDWKMAISDSPRKIIEERYGIPVSKLKFFTFEKCE